MAKRKNARAILISILIIVLSIAVLTVTTLAWFTDTETNKGNLITAGDLDISATWYDLADANDTTNINTYTINKIDYTFATGTDDGTSFADSGAMIAEEDFAPSYVSAKLITVTNNGSIDAVISLSVDVAEQEGDYDLEDELWFDFIQITNGAVTGTYTERDMSTLSTVLSSYNKQQNTLSEGESFTFVLIYGMDTDADNNYQKLSYGVDLTVSATQVGYTAE
ncbi:MAG: SipW-dependent-type signal peptide-containing protein [Bacillota bacterium]